MSSPLPFSFGFAAGAMLTLIVVEMLPKAYANPSEHLSAQGRTNSCSAWIGPTAGIALGAALMLALSALLGV